MNPQTFLATLLWNRAQRMHAKAQRRAAAKDHRAKRDARIAMETVDAFSAVVSRIAARPVKYLS